MNFLIGRASNGARGTGLMLLGITLMALTILSGCEDPGVVGNAIVGEQNNLTFDTLQVSDVKTISQSTYSGNLPYLSAGAYNDQLFGDIRTIAALRPAITHVGDTLTTEAEAILSLSIDTTQTYGDTLGTQTFDLVEVGSAWRGNTFKYDSEFQLTNNTIASNIQLGLDDSVTVSLPSSWVQQYRDFYYRPSGERDSVYVRQYYGFALVPQNQSKIVAIQPSASKILLKNPSDTTYKQQSIKDYAFSLERSNVPQMEEGTTPVYSTFEQFIDFDFPFNEDTLGSQNLSRVELAWYVDQEKLDNTLPANHVRPPISGVAIYVKQPESIAAGFFNMSPSFSSNVTTDDNTYRYNYTPLVNTMLYSDTPDYRYYLVPQSNNGVIHSTLLYNQAGGTKQPKFLITSVKAE